MSHPQRIACALLAVWGLACGDAGLCENTSQVETPSSDGKYTAWVFIRACGPTVPSAVHVSVLPAGSPVPNEPGNAFALEPVAALEVKWSSDRELRISRAPGPGKVLAQQSRVGEVAVTYALE
jgi:hypothetical protein